MNGKALPPTRARLAGFVRPPRGSRLVAPAPLPRAPPLAWPAIAHWPRRAPGVHHRHQRGGARAALGPSSSAPARDAWPRPQHARPGSRSAVHDSVGTQGSHLFAARVSHSRWPDITAFSCLVSPWGLMPSQALCTHLKLSPSLALARAGFVMRKARTATLVGRGADPAAGSGWPVPRRLSETRWPWFLSPPVANRLWLARRHHCEQRCHQRVREGEAVAVGAGVAGPRSFQQMYSSALYSLCCAVSYHFTRIKRLRFASLLHVGLVTSRKELKTS